MENLTRFDTSGSAQRLRALVGLFSQGPLSLTVVVQSDDTPVDYRPRSLARFFAQIGKTFDWVLNPGRGNLEPIEACCGIDREKRTAGMCCFRISQNVATGEILLALAAIGYRPAVHEELWAFSVKHPDVQTGSTVVALGSVQKIGHSINVAQLVNDMRGRGFVLDFDGPDRVWSADHYTFLAVPIG